jgi:uncharacterized protein with PQ loop repeat
MHTSDMIGLAGALIAGAAYLPQIIHLIKEHCSAGISRRAYALWFLASILITINAVWADSMVFVVLGVIQVSATAIIYFFSTKYAGQVCPTHRNQITQSPQPNMVT